MKLKIGKLTGVLILGAGILCTVALIVLSGGNGKDITCAGLEVEYVPQSGGLTDPDAIRKTVLDQYGVFVGQRTDSIRMDRMEKILDGVGAIEKSQVYLTRDGMVHARIKERTPVLKFIFGEKVRYVDGNAVVFLSEGQYSGNTVTARGLPREGEKGWLKGMIKVARYVDASAERGILFSDIEVDEMDGSIALKASDGAERFILGKPSGCGDALFRRIDRYYRDIRPESKYSMVDVRYHGQIICKN